MNTKPLLSIVVPTKDRYKYLEKLIELVHSFNNNDLEMVIQDNTDDNSVFLQYLSTHKEYKFIRYDHTKGQIPVSENSDKAILNSTGEYVCFIGDDDGVTSYIIDCVKWMKKNEVDCMLPQSVFYKWPDYVSVINNDRGKLSHRHFDGCFKKISTKGELEKLMARGCVDRGGVPLVYHGIVKRSTLDKIYEKCKTYFPGPSPDLANGVALCLVTDFFYTVSLPITISGASQVHGGGIRKMKNRVAEIDSLGFLPKGCKENWEKSIPRVWAGETVWPESAIKAMRNMGEERLIECVNFDYLYSSFIAFHYPIRTLALSLTKNKTSVMLNAWCKIIKRYATGAIRLVYTKLLKKEKGMICYYNKESIIDAVRCLEEENKDILKNAFIDNLH